MAWILALLGLAPELVLDERLADLQSSKTYRLRTTPDADVNGLLGGVAQVQSTFREGEGVWHIGVTGELDVAADRLAQALVSSGQPLFELALVKRDLETVFREVNEEARDAA